jgi:hypothetical protein
MDKTKATLLIRHLLKTFRDHPERFGAIEKMSDPNESTPENHMRMAIHHSHMAGHHPDSKPGAYNHDEHMRHTMHTDIALSHYAAAGHSRQAAAAEHQRHMQQHHMTPKDGKPPHDESSLRLNWQKKHNDRFPSGVGYDYSN